MTRTAATEASSAPAADSPAAADSSPPADVAAAAAAPTPPDASAAGATPAGATPAASSADAAGGASAPDAAAAGRLGRVVRGVAVVAALAAVIIAVGGVLGHRDTPSTPEAAAPAPKRDSSAALDASISSTQERLRRLPHDYVAWAALGGAYLEKSRITADPTWYAKSQGALQRSLKERPNPNPAALTGLGALANARHDFATARTHALAALKQNPYSADAYGVLADAETQLGHADAATAAVQHMLDLRPALAAYTRASYDLEQHGKNTEAAALMRQALTSAVDPADVAFCRYQLGELAWNSGDLTAAAREYQAGLAASPDYLPLLQGTAKVATARGNLNAAITSYKTLTQRSPTPGYLLEYAELLQAAGRTAEAGEQLALADAAGQLFAANGGSDDLTTVSLALARGKPTEALAAAQREWKRRQFADVADAMAQALHANGRDAEALRYTRKASALGVRSARFQYHQGVILAALGRPTEARRALSGALALNPHFSPVEAPAARRALAELPS
ncbi:tetratricopeptide repeat protein [Cryptosporangium sp. NPDC048952]|uniref:tetratricopeptide repeat protein n=1 Tax=Cryptosporangium sp. NPDC048952 TaxID=3363961 RepID=UPI0037206228